MDVMGVGTCIRETTLFSLCEKNPIFREEKSSKQKVMRWKRARTHNEFIRKETLIELIKKCLLCLGFNSSLLEWEKMNRKD